MKRETIKLCDKQYEVDYDFKEHYNQVVIYHLVGDTPLPIYIGSTLKSACMKWLKHIDDISVIFSEFEIWCSSNGHLINEINYDNVKEVGKIWDMWLETLSGEELFIMLMPDDSFSYVDWSQVEECE